MKFTFGVLVFLLVMLLAGCVQDDSPEYLKAKYLAEMECSKQCAEIGHEMESICLGKNHCHCKKEKAAIK